MIVESTWTYRVVRQIHPEGDSYTIREIYTDTEIANGKPVRTITAFSAEPEYPMGETPQELMENLEQMMEALKKPMLEMSELEKIVGRKSTFGPS